MRCGFIGLGHIGKFLAGSLVRNGFEVTVYDLNKEAAAPLVRLRQRVRHRRERARNQPR